MNERHVPGLDGLRGLAIILVLLDHLAAPGVHPLFPVTGLAKPVFILMASGWWGVDLFFVLSGFLITGILLRTKSANHRASSFYARRALRIFPIYYLTLVVVLLSARWSGWVDAYLPQHWYDRAAYAVYLQNWAVVWNHWHFAPSLIGHFWSLAVEEQFYLVWPLLVWTLPVSRVLKLAVFGAGCALVLRILLVAHFGPQVWIHHITAARGEGLLVGSALAVIGLNGRITKRLILSMAIAGAAFILFIAIVHGREFSNTDAGPYAYTIGTTGFVLIGGTLVAAVKNDLRLVTRIFEMSWLRSMGKYSYGIYVYHAPLLAVFRYVLLPKFGLAFPLKPWQAVTFSLAVLTVTFTIAWVSYNFFEKRFLALKDRFRASEGSRARAAAALA